MNGRLFQVGTKMLISFFECD
ncbi:unnamed protein product [Lathyrus oleraceus]